MAHDHCGLVSNRSRPPEFQQDARDSSVNRILALGEWQVNGTRTRFHQQTLHLAQVIVNHSMRSKQFTRRLPCPYPPIEKKTGLKYGTSQIAHTATLNLWKLMIQRSSLLAKTTVAQTACTNIRVMATRPVTP